MSTDGTMSFERVLIERWAREHHTYLYRLAFSMLRSRDDAVECVQETFVRALRFRRLDTVERPKAWLATVLRNVVRNHARRKARLPEVVSDADLDAPTPDGTDEQDRRIAVASALTELPVRMQELLRLSYWVGLTDREVAEVVGIPTGTVKSSLHRARRMLQETLSA